MLAAGDLTLSDDDFRFIVETMYRQAGIQLAEHKRNLVYSRLTKRLRTLGMPDFKSYCELLKGPSGASELGAMINALTTNVTSFFREAHHFEHLQQVALPETVKHPTAHTRRLRIWSSACSTGEEPYSIAMALKSAEVDLRGWDVRILATDLDTVVLAAAMKGVYSQQAIKKLPPDLARRFTEPANKNSNQSRIKDELRQIITFKNLNLLGKWPMKGSFDIIFCRNVLIYFDTETKSRLIDRFVTLLRPGGWLYLGHSETLNATNSALVLEGRTTYRRLP